MAQEVEIKEFGVEDTPKPFKIHGVTYYILGDLPLTLVDSLAKWQSKGIHQSILDGGKNMLMELIAEFMVDESYARFKEGVDRKEIGLRIIIDMIPWMLEQYGLRPTQPSSPSLDGSDDGETGISSTDGVLPEESILFNSVPIAS